MYTRENRIRSRRPASYHREWRARTKPHRHKQMTSRVIRALKARLGLTNAQLGAQIGVVELTISKWCQPHGKLGHPLPKQWIRVRELWWFTKYIKTVAFWIDREDPPDFRQ